MKGIFFDYIFDETDERQRCTNCRQVYLAAFASLLLALVIGLVDAFPSTALVDMDKRDSPVHPSEDMKTWIASVHDFGELTGCLLAIFLSDKLGRVTSLVLTTFPYVIGWIMIMEAQFATIIIAGRILTGIGNGLCMAIIPTYLIEISSTKIRGLLGASFEMFDVLGIVLSNVIGSFVPWTRLALISGLIPVASLCFLSFMPESPRWLVAKKLEKDAIKSLKFLHGVRVDAVRKVDAIKQDLLEQGANEGLTISEMRQGIFWKPAVLSLILILFKQLCGSCVFMYYNVWIFKSTDTTLDSNVCAIIVTAVQLIFTFISMFIMNKFDRRTLLITSAIAMFLSLTVFGAFFYAKEHHVTIESDVMNYVPLLSVVAYTAFYSVGFGPIPWIMIGELAPLKARSAISGLSACFNAIMALATTKTFIDIQSVVGKSGTYWMYGGTCLLSVIFVSCFLPETRGKSLEDILEIFAAKKSATSSGEENSINVHGSYRPNRNSVYIVNQNASSL